MELKLDYPIYAAESFSLNKKNYLLTVGGGGPKGYGVANTVELLKINNVKNKIKEIPIVTSVAKYDQLTDQILNVHYNNQMVALGEGSDCRFFRISEKSESGNSQSSLKKRTGKGSENKSDETDGCKNYEFEDYGKLESHKSKNPDDSENIYQTCTEPLKKEKVTADS